MISDPDNAALLARMTYQCENTISSAFKQLQSNKLLFRKLAGRGQEGIRGGPPGYGPGLLTDTILVQTTLLYSRRIPSIGARGARAPKP
jgi:hypothetical protein